jgi:hypothetical protein
MRDEVIGGWIKLHNEELHNLYTSPKFNYNYQVNENEMDRTCSTNGRKRRRIRSLHVGFWWGSQKERVRQEDAYLGWRIILKQFTGNRMGWCRLNWSGPGANEELL